jgi:hypothetical protein
LQNDEARGLARGLLAADSADAGRTAEKAVRTWRALDAALAPIIGHRGFAALYRRSLYLARTAHPCFAAVHDGELQPPDFAALQTALSQQTGADAVAANAALLQTFHDLLTSLIGTALTERLLRSVWDQPPSGDAAQDTSR